MTSFIGRLSDCRDADGGQYSFLGVDQGLVTFQKALEGACARWSAAYGEQGIETAYMKPAVSGSAEQVMGSGKGSGKESEKASSFCRVLFLALRRVTLKVCTTVHDSPYVHDYAKVNGNRKRIGSKNEIEKGRRSGKGSGSESENGRVYGSESLCMKSN